MLKIMELKPILLPINLNTFNNTFLVLLKLQEELRVKLFFEFDTQTYVLLWHYGASQFDIGDVKHLKL